MTDSTDHKHRQYGIEWLRVWSMFFITLGHLVGYAAKAEVEIDAGGEFSWLLPLGTGAVDCFVLTTGYFGIRQERALSKALSIYAEVVFYGLVVALVFLFVPAHRAYPVHFAKSLFPLMPTTFNYWFVTKYLGLLLLSPFLNRLMVSLGKRGLLALVAVLLFLNLSLFANGLFPWGGQYGGGWTLMWFICLYACGYAMHRFKKELLNVPKTIWGGYWLVLYLLYVCHARFHCLKWADLGYNSVFTFSTAICLFMLALSWENCSATIIRWLSPGIFAVYVLHSNFFIRAVLTDDVMPWMQQHRIASPMGLMVLTVAIFLSSVCLDYLRQLLFQRLCLNVLCQQIGNRLNSLCLANRPPTA